MTMEQISVGILAPSAEVRESLAVHVEATGLAEVKVRVDEYCAVEDDHPTATFLEAQPQIIIVDMQDVRAAVKALFTLHAVLPEAWLYASCNSSDPQLIIETMHAGAREFMPKPVTARSLSTAFARYLDEKNRLRTDLKERGRIFSVTAAKGGAGATSVAINIAVTLATVPDTRVALIDLNSPVGDVAAYLNQKPQFTVADALAAAPRLDPVLLETFTTKASGVSVLAGPKKFQAGPTPAPAALAKLLRVAAQTHSHIFIDLPSSLDLELLRVVTDASEAVLVVLTPEFPALWRTHRLVLFLASTGCADRLRLVLNRDNSRAEIDEKEIKKALNYPIYWRLPNNYSSAIQAVNQGKPIVTVNHSSLASSYKKLSHELSGLPLPQKRRGLMRLFV